MIPILSIIFQLKVNFWLTLNALDIFFLKRYLGPTSYQSREYIKLRDDPGTIDRPSYN